MEFSFSNLEGLKNVSRFSNIELGKAGFPASDAVYNLKGSFLGWLVCSLRFSVNKGYRERVIESRKAALSTLRDSEQMRREFETLRLSGNAGDVDRLEGQLRDLEDNVGHGRRFFRGVQELVRSVSSGPVVKTAGKRSGWTERTEALGADSNERYAKFDVKRGKVGPVRVGPVKVGPVVGPVEVGLVALDYMTEAITSDGRVVGVAAMEDSVECEDLEPRMEARERALLAMSFLKFLTIEPHAYGTEPLFRWEKTEDLVKLRSKRCGGEETVDFGEEKWYAEKLKMSEVLVPDKELQKYVVACFDKCQYEKEHGVLVDFRLFEANSGEYSLAEGVSESDGPQQLPLNGEQQNWVAGQLKRFLQ